MSSRTGALGSIWIASVLMGGMAFGMLPNTDFSTSQTKYVQGVAEAVFAGGRAGTDLPEFRELCLRKLAEDGRVVFRERYRKLLAEEDWLYEVDYQLGRLAKKEITVPSDEELMRKAEELYPVYRKGQRVSIVYKKNPLVVTSLEGVFSGCESGILHVGGRSIRLQDMTGIVDNEKEILKFLPEESLRKRREYVEGTKEEAEKQRKLWRDENHDRISAELSRKMGGVNERNGYLFYRGDWYDSRKACDLIIRDVWENCRSRVRQEALRRRRSVVEGMREQVRFLCYMDEISPLGTRLSPEAELARRDAIRRKERLAAEMKQRKLEEERQARIREQQEKIKAIEEQKRRKRERQLEQIRNQKVENPKDFEQGFFTVKVLCVGMGVVLFAGVFLLLAIRRRERGNDLSRFFQGKGRLQKDFWDAATSDPDHFRYVAYLFPGIAEANEALARMSYIGMDSAGKLHCNKEIRFGAYPHQNGAVAFVGGTRLNYALWKEASAVWPELDGAQYFRVSPEPVVLVEVPDLTKINGMDNQNIRDLGIKDITGEHGEIVRCYNFEADAREHAMAFLEAFAINEEGVVARVTLADGSGTLTKDSKGITTPDDGEGANGGDEGGDDNGGAPDESEGASAGEDGHDEDGDASC